MSPSRSMKYFTPLLILILAIAVQSYAQDDLMKMLEEETKKDEKPTYTTATFKTTRIVNGHSVENVAAGVLDLRISHRFGFVNSGAYELWGLDQAYMRLGFDYGITKWLMIGVGRSTYQKQFDGFTKIKIFRQSTGVRDFPVTMSVVGSMIYTSLKFEDPSRANYITSQLAYTGQLLLGRKFNENLSLQLMPTIVHYNLVQDIDDPNDLFSVGIGGRIKLSKRVSLNAEYYYQLPGYKFANTYNSIALGFDIETGGHVFQVNVTNSTGMTERNFINETIGDFFKGDIHIGFTISRVFTLSKPKRYTDQ